MTERPISPPADQYLLTAAMAAIIEARRDLEHGWLASADQYLTAAQYHVLSAGARDVGEIPAPRNDLPDDVNLQLTDLQRSVENREERIGILEDALDEVLAGFPEDPRGVEKEPPDPLEREQE